MLHFEMYVLFYDQTGSVNKINQQICRQSLN